MSKNIKIALFVLFLLVNGIMIYVTYESERKANYYFFTPAVAMAAGAALMFSFQKLFRNPNLKCKFPLDAHNFEVFALREGEAYIGWKDSSGFHFTQVPFSEPMASKYPAYFTDKQKPEEENRKA
jgi:hypothetical protein